ncbi:MAG: DUF5131 family protein [Clostridia bacterium]|nr:DUF5131 family protein [Clostridia bacterium]
MNRTKIDWCDYTFNPVTGCLHECKYCYAEKIANRFGLAFAPRLDEVDGCKYDSPVGMDTMLELNKPYYKSGRIQPYPMAFLPTFHRYHLDEPAKIKQPQKVFVCSMGDLFGDWVPSTWICDVLNVVEFCLQHTFLFLTKNPKRYQEFEFPANAWIGTSVENQQAADERIPLLLQAQAAVRFISAEPLLGPIDLSQYLPKGMETGDPPEDDPLGPDVACPECEAIHEFGAAENDPYCERLNWIICGTESGPKRRPAMSEWIISLRDQCQTTGVPFFLKQMDVAGKLVKMPELDGKVWSEFPEVTP